jgi:hypothetical protein
MFSQLLRRLGLMSAPRQPSKRKKPSRPRSATSHVFEKKPAQKVKSDAQGDSENGFNPYNTGKFDRSASWEHISKNQR